MVKVNRSGASYLLMVTDQGEPYIAHAGFWSKKNHKYLAKVKTAFGWRYFYTQQEIDAYNNNKHRSKNKIQYSKDSVKQQDKIVEQWSHERKVAKKYYEDMNDKLNDLIMKYESTNGHRSFDEGQKMRAEIKAIGKKKDDAYAQYRRVEGYYNKEHNLYAEMLKNIEDD